MIRTMFLETGQRADFNTTKGNHSKYFLQPCPCLVDQRNFLDGPDPHQHVLLRSVVCAVAHLSCHSCYNKFTSNLPLYVKEKINPHYLYRAQPYNNPINYSAQQSVNVEQFTNSPIIKYSGLGLMYGVVSTPQTNLVFQETLQKTSYTLATPNVSRQILRGRVLSPQIVGQLFSLGYMMDGHELSVQSIPLKIPL